MTKKRLLSLIITAVILLQLLSVDVFPTENELFVFKLSDNGEYYSITDITDISVFEINIPDEYNGKPVKGIEKSAFSGALSAYKVTLPTTVTYVSPGAFIGMPSLHEIVSESESYTSADGVLFTADKTTLVAYPQALEGIYSVPDGTIIIEDSAFFRASGLSEIILPETLTSIGDNSFTGTPIKDIIIPDSVVSVGEYAFSETLVRTVKLPAATVGKGAFSGCVKLKFADISSATSVGEYVFDGCVSLLASDIPTALTAIPTGMFRGCMSMTIAPVPDSITHIENEAFSGCTSLKYAYIGSGTTLSDTAFSACDALTVFAPQSSAAHTYAVNNGIDYIENSLEARTSGIITPTDISLSPQQIYEPTITVTGDYIMLPNDSSVITSNNRTLTAVKTGRTEVYAITVDGGFVSVTDVNVSEGVPLIESAHPYTPGETVEYSYTVPGDVTRSAVTFSSETMLSEGDTLTLYNGNGEKIGTYTGTFLAGKTLFIDGDTVKIKLVSTSQSVAYGFSIISAVDVSSLTAVESITLDKTSLNMYSGESSKLTPTLAPSDAYHTEILFVSGDNSIAVVSQDGVVNAVSPGQTSITVYSTYYGVLASCSVTVNENSSDGFVYTVSGRNALITLYKGSSLTPSVPSAVNGYTVTSISAYAFAFTDITSVTIPATVTSVAANTFLGCNKLTSFNVANGNAYLSSSGGFLMNKNGQTLICVAAGLSGDVTVPATVQTVRSTAFNNCYSITGITLGPSVTDITGRCFTKCVSLSDINVSGTIYSSVNGVLYNYSKTELIYYPAAKTGDLFLPDTVTTIRDYAFTTCSAYSSVTIPAGITSIGSLSFAYSELTHILTAAENASFASYDGILYAKDKSTLISVPPARQNAVIVEKETLRLGNNAFYGCSQLNDVFMHEGLIGVGNYTFAYCNSLSFLIFPQSLVSFGLDSFLGCRDISVYIPPRTTQFCLMNGIEVLCEKESPVHLLCENNNYNFSFMYSSVIENVTAYTEADTGITLLTPDDAEIADITVNNIYASTEIYKLKASAGAGAMHIRIVSDKINAFAYEYGKLVPIPVNVFGDFICFDIENASTIVLTSDIVLSNTAIGIASMPGKLIYEQGAEFNGDGMSLYYSSAGEKTKIVTDGWSVECDLTKTGDRTAVISYNGATCTLIVTVAEMQISGTLTLTGTYEFGTVITADTTGIIPSVADLSFSWYRNGTPIENVTANTYTVTASDIGSVITAAATGVNGFTGNIVSDGVECVKFKPTVTIPPKALSVTPTSVTLVPADGYEYRMSGEKEYVKSNVFNNLLPGKTYLIYQRIAETDTNFPSEKTGINFTTSPLFEITSTKYNINKINKTISKIEPQTTVDAFLKGMDYPQLISVYQNGKLITGDSFMATGCEVRLYSGTDLITTVKVAITGDVNSDGKATITDYIRVKRRIQTGEALSDVYEYSCDINGDGKISITDYIKLKHCIQGHATLIQNAY